MEKQIPYLHFERTPDEKVMSVSKHQTLAPCSGTNGVLKNKVSFDIPRHQICIIAVKLASACDLT